VSFQAGLEQPHHAWSGASSVDIAMSEGPVARLDAMAGIQYAMAGVRYATVSVGCATVGAPYATVGV